MSGTAETREVILTSDSSGENWSVAAWDPRSGSLLTSYKNATALGNGTLQIIGGSHLLGADITKPRLHIWPLNSQMPVPNLRLSTPGKVTALRCTPNGLYLVAAVSEKLFVWQLSTGRLLGTLNRHYQTVTCLVFSKDGSVFASGGEDGLIFVWSLYNVLNEEQPAPIHGFSHHSLPVKDLYFGQFGARGRICSASLDRTANIYESDSGTLLMTLVFDVPLTSICMNIRESELFVGCTDGTIHKFDLREPPRGIEHHVKINVNSSTTDQRPIFRGHKATITSLSVSVDCRTLLSASADGNVHIWDIPSRQVLRTIEHKGSVTSAFFAKHYENFRIQDLKSNLKISSLQRISDEAGKDNVIEVISRDFNSEKFLDFDFFTGKGTSGSGVSVDQTSRQIDEMREEIDRLKSINAEMYKFSVEYILNQPEKT